MKRTAFVVVIAVASVAAADAPKGDPATCPDQNACDNVAYDLKKTDPKGAELANERACTFGEKYACEEAAQEWLEGGALATDLKKALELRMRGCRLGNRDSCVAVGLMYLRGFGTAKDSKKAVTNLEKGCAAGALLGCADLALIYRDGDGVKADANKSFAFSVKACSDGGWNEHDGEDVALGCEIAGLALVRGTGRKADPAKAIQYFAAECDRSPKFCFNFAVSLLKGSGTDADPARARQFFGRACDGGNGDGCVRLGELATNGVGGAKDADLAKKAYAEACRLGVTDACKH